MRVWLDDMRPMPDGYDVWVMNAESCVEILWTGKVEHISLDHDLGNKLDGMHVARWMAEFPLAWGTWSCHSMNPVGKERIVNTLPADRRRPVVNDKA